MLILPTILLLISLTTAAPTTDASILHQLPKRAVACYSADLARVQSLNAEDCMQAIARLPTTRVPGMAPMATTQSDWFDGLVARFGNAEPVGSPFKLPRAFSFNRCYVGVTLVSPVPGTSETSSWNEIASRARDVVAKCVVHVSRQRGGSNHAGRGKGIYIEVFGDALGFPGPGAVAGPAVLEAAAGRRAGVS